MTQEQYDLVVIENWIHPASSIEDLNKKVLISYFYTEEDRIRFEEHVLRFYHNQWKKSNKPPILFQVVEDVYEYNYELFTQMALIDLSQEYDLSMLEQDEFEEIIEERTDSISEMYFQYDCLNIEYAVADVLDRYKLVYRSDADDCLFDYIESHMMIEKMSALEKNSEIEVNDCQIVMFDEMLDAGFTTNAGTLVCHNTNSTALTVVE